MKYDASTTKPIRIEVYDYGASRQEGGMDRQKRRSFGYFRIFN